MEVKLSIMKIYLWSFFAALEVLLPVQAVKSSTVVPGGTASLYFAQA